MKVDLVDDTTFNVSLVTTDRTTGKVKTSQSYSDKRLTSGEYTDANAVVTYMIGSDTTQLIIYGGESTEASATFPESVNYNDTLMNIDVVTGYATVSALYVDDTEVAFTTTDTGISVLVSDLPAGLNGEISARIVLSDGTELTGNFNYVNQIVYELADIIDFGDADSILLDSVGESVVSEPVGYGNWVKVHCDSVLGAVSGDNNIYIGSYGVRLRGGDLRVHTYSASGKSTEIGRNLTELETNFNHFKNSYDVYMKVDIVSETVARLSFKVYKTGTDTIVIPEESYDITRLASDEVSSDNASITFKLGSSAATGCAITVYKD